MSHASTQGKRPLQAGETATDARQAFLRQFIEADKPVTLILEDLEISKAQLGRWMARPDFRRRLRRAVALWRRVRDLEVEAGALRAAYRLACAPGDDRQLASDKQRRACAELIRLVRDPHARHSRLLPTPFKSALVHPDVPAPEARELMKSVASC